MRKNISWLKPHLKNSHQAFAAEAALSQVMEMETIDMVLTAVVGFAGLKPTMAAIKAGKQIALANKETLVVAGELVTALAKKKLSIFILLIRNTQPFFSALQGNGITRLKKFISRLQADRSIGKDKTFLSTVKKEQALKHPNWDMGAKITIDSASMMNKGLEMVEQNGFFTFHLSRLTIYHPQSIIHSIVQFRDGSMKAQMGLPDMKLPIQMRWNTRNA